MQHGSVNYTLNTHTLYTCFCVCGCRHKVACTSTCGYLKARLYLHMRMCCQSPPLLLQRYLLHPLDASHQPLIACRHTAGRCFHTVSFDSLAHFLLITIPP